MILLSDFSVFITFNSISDLAFMKIRYMTFMNKQFQNMTFLNISLKYFLNFQNRDRIQRLVTKIIENPLLRF